MYYFIKAWVIQAYNYRFCTDFLKENMDYLQEILQEGFSLGKWRPSFIFCSVKFSEDRFDDAA